MVSKKYQKYKNKIKDYYLKHKKEIDKYTCDYNQQNRNRINFGGNKQLVLERDNWSCQKCGMTNEQHILLYGVCITVHHIDGKGRYSKEKNNEIDNLITLCCRCHGREDALRYYNLIKSKKGVI